MSNRPTTYVSVAIPGPLRKTFTYAAPSNATLQPGQRLLVPFGRQNVVGFYIGPTEKPPAEIKVKAISEIIDRLPLLPDELIKLLLWMADYYFANPAECLLAAIPTQLKSRRKLQYVWTTDKADFVPSSLNRLMQPGKAVSALALKRIGAIGKDYLGRLRAEGLIVEQVSVRSGAPAKKLLGYRIVRPDLWQDLFDRADSPPAQFHGVRTRIELQAAGITDHYRRKAQRLDIIEPVYDESEAAVQATISAREGIEHIAPNEPQAEVIRTVGEALARGFQTYLLHGITGSGKTLVYCHLARRVLEQDKTVLVLTPEIALSSTTLAYFRGFFGESVTVLHSGMTQAERLVSWNGIRNGRYKIVVGPRSALFAPLEDIGLIVVDEEHDDSYKQDDPSPRFHGRDAAIVRARINSIPIVLGSASPSLESYYHACSGRYQLLEINKRPAGARLPTVQLVDMRRERIGGDLPFVSLPLKTAVAQHLGEKRQAILFLNRRGYAPYLKCRDCGHIPLCPSCQVRLTYHKSGDHLACHYCGLVETEYAVCESCKGTEFLFFGAGTQKVEEMVERLWPGARPVRLDSDTAAGRANTHALLSAFAGHEFNLLLGTQMVTKGLDLPDVSLVGVLAADMGMGLPDFRASERTFARLLQVAGRSGRANHPGRVMVQTWDPEQPVITDAARQDYRSFYDREIELRREGFYPPFCRLVNIIFSADSDRDIETTSHQFRDSLIKNAAQRKLDVQVLGPAPCAFHRLRGKYRRHLFVKVTPEQAVRFVRMLSDWEGVQPRFGLATAVKITIDVDPADML